jgi:DNA-binding HxlR family transcriptional regulator
VEIRGLVQWLELVAEVTGNQRRTDWPDQGPRRMTRRGLPAGTTRVLEVLGAAPKRAVIGALMHESLRPVELSGRLLISSATLYRHLPDLEELGVLVKQGVHATPYAVRYSLTEAGQELGEVALQIEGWLRLRRPVPLDPASQSAWKAAIALSEGWATSIMQSLVNGPLSESELVAQVVEMSHYEVCGRLHRLVDVGVLQRLVVPQSGRKGHYALSEWGRRGVGVLATAARWAGRRIPGQDASVTTQDGVAALLMTLPLVQPIQLLDGLCEFRIREHEERVGPHDAAVWAEIRDGRYTLSGRGVPPRPPTAWSHGTLRDWFVAVVDRRPTALRRGGDQRLANGILMQLHDQLYRQEGSTPTPAELEPALDRA